MSMRKRISTGPLLIILIISIFNSVIFAIAGENVEIEYHYPGKNSYYDLTITWTDSSGQHTETYPGWCADSSVYVTNDPDYILVSSCDPSQLPDFAFDDENWCAINILLNQWQTSNDPIYEVSWVYIQQIIWYYADSGYDLGDQLPKPMESDWKVKCNAIISDVDEIAEEGCEGIPCAIICVPVDNPTGHQLLFFTVPEIPLGTIGAALSMFSAYIIKRKNTQ